MPGPSGNVRDTGDFDFRAFFMDIPPVTRTLFITIFSFTLLSGLGIIPMGLYLLVWPEVLRLQVWRLLFTFFHIGRLGLAFLIRIYFLFTYSKQLEIGVFFGRPANYAWFLSIVSMTVLCLSVFKSAYVNGGALLMAIIHLWGRHATNVTVNMYGFIQIPAKYLSLTMLALDVIIQGGVSPSDVYGLLGGHLYYFLDSVYPTMPQGKQLISVPIWFERFIDQVQAVLGSVTGLHSNPPPQQSGRVTSRNTRRGGITDLGSSSSSSQSNQASSSSWRSGFTTPGSRHNWGAGHTLGSS